MPCAANEETHRSVTKCRGFIIPDFAAREKGGLRKLVVQIGHVKGEAVWRYARPLPGEKPDSVPLGVLLRHGERAPRIGRLSPVDDPPAWVDPKGRLAGTGSMITSSRAFEHDRPTVARLDKLQLKQRRATPQLDQVLSQRIRDKAGRPEKTEENPSGSRTTVA